MNAQKAEEYESKKEPQQLKLLKIKRKNKNQL